MVNLNLFEELAPLVSVLTLLTVLHSVCGQDNVATCNASQRVRSILLLTF
jgi:hypothetical protein